MSGCLGSTCCGGGFCEFRVPVGGGDGFGGDCPGCVCIGIGTC